jgi:hypothetical protein
MTKKLPIENSGWKTFAEISRETHLSLYSVYTRGGGMGPAKTELKRRGLIEDRIFSGERGRGGEIMKARIDYEQDIVKEYVSRKMRGSNGT